MTNPKRSGKINLKVVIILVVVAGVLVGGAFLARYARSRIISAEALAEGNSAYEAERWEDACKHFAEYLSRNPRDEDILTKYAEANLLVEPLKRENVGAAIDANRRLMRLRPEDDESYKSLARLYRFVGDYAELGYIADRLLEQKSGDLRARLWKAQALEGQGKRDEALASLGIDPKDKESLKSLQFHKPKYLEDLERRGEMQKEHVEACLLIIRLLAEDASGTPTDRKRRVDGVLEWAASYAPDRALPYLTRAHYSISWLAQGNITADELSKVLPEYLVATLPEGLQARLAKGNISADELGKVLREYLEFAGRRPTVSPRAHLALIDVWLNLQELEKAREQYEAAEGAAVEEIRREYVDLRTWELEKFMRAERLFTMLYAKDDRDAKEAKAKCEVLAASASSAFEESRWHKLAALPALCPLHSSLEQSEKSRKFLDSYRELANTLQYAIPRATNAGLESRIGMLALLMAVDTFDPLYPVLRLSNLLHNLHTSRWVLAEGLFTMLYAKHDKDAKETKAKCEELVAFASSAFEQSPRHKLGSLPPLCRLYSSLGRSEEARKCLESYRELSNTLQQAIPRTMDAGLEAWICALEVKPYRVIELLEPLWEDKDLDLAGMRRLGSAYAATRQPARAAEVYGQCEAMAYEAEAASSLPSVQSAQATRDRRNRLWRLAHNRARQLTLQGDWQGAGEVLEEAAEKLEQLGGVPESTVEEELLGIRCKLHACLRSEPKVRDRELAKLASQLSALRQKHHQRADIRLLEANIAGVQGRTQEAEGILVQAAEECRETTPVKLLLARRYAETERLDEAVNLCRKVCDEHPSEDTAWKALSQYKFKEQGLAAAREVLKKGLGKVVDPDGYRRLEATLESLPREPLDVKLRLARRYAKKGRLDEAVVLCRKLCEENPTEDAAWAALSRYEFIVQGLAAGRKVIEEGLAKVEDHDGRRRLSIMLASHDLLAGGTEAAFIARLSRPTADDKSDLERRLRMLALPPIRADRSRAQLLVDEIRAIEGETGLNWRYQQALLWFEGPDWARRSDEIERLVTVCMHADDTRAAPVVLLSLLLERRGDLERATQVCDSAFEANPGAVRIADRLIRLLRRQDQPDKAAEVVKKLRAGQRALETARYILALDRGDTGEAIDHLKVVASDLKERGAPSHVQLARLVYLRGGEGALQAAMAHLDAAEEIDRDLIDITDFRAFILREEGLVEEALEIINERVERLDDFESRHLRAEFFKSIKELEEAEKEYKGLTQLKDSNGSGHVLLARFYSQQGRAGDAVTVLKQGLKELPDNRALGRSLLNLYLSLGTERYERALVLVDQLRAQGDPDIRLDYARARLLLTLYGQRSAEAQEAESMLQDIVAREPTYVAAHLDLIGIASRRFDWKEARQRAVRAMATNPLNASLQIARADIERRLGNTTLAGSLAREVLEKNPANADAIGVLASAGRPDPATLDEARKLAEDAVRDNPTEPALRLVLADILERQGLRTNAIDCLRQFRKAAPETKDIRVILALADLLRLDGKQEEVDALIDEAAATASAEPRIERARMRNCADSGDFDGLAKRLDDYRKETPGDLETAHVGASALLQSGSAGHRAQATEVLRDVVLAAPGWVEARSALAFSLYLQGDPTSAIAEYRKALADNPNHVPALNDLAWILSTDRGEHKEALELVNKGLGIDSDDIHLLDTRGVILREMDRNDEAKKDFERLVELTATQPGRKAKALLQLARTYHQTGESQKAAEHLNQAREIDEKESIFSEQEREEIAKLLTQCQGGAG